MFTIGAREETTNTVLSSRNALSSKRKSDFTMPPNLSPRNSPRLTAMTSPRATPKSRGGQSRSTRSRLPEIVSRAETTISKTSRKSQLTNITSVTSPKKPIYDVNYIIDIDTQIVTSRQNGRYVNNYYKKMVNSRILQSPNPSPILKSELKAIRRYQSPSPIPPKKTHADSRY